MKKKRIVIAGIVLAIAFSLAGAYFYAASNNYFHKGDLSGYAAEHPYAGREVKPMHLRENGEFVILKFTDLHFTTGKGLRDSKILREMEAALSRARPDLVVITGDMLSGINNTSVDKKGALCKIANLFEYHAQPWAYVPGNHDGEHLGSTEDVAAYLARNFNLCVLSNEEGLTGATQYAIPLLYADGAVAHALLFMDSLGYEEDEGGEWVQECMKEDQVEWLATQLLGLKHEAPQALAGVFFHFETPALAQATEPENWHDWSPAGNAAIDDAMREAGNVGLLSIGHWHQSHLAFQNGMYYHVTLNAPGASVITITPGAEDAQGMYRFEEVVVQ